MFLSVSAFVVSPSFSYNPINCSAALRFMGSKSSACSKRDSASPFCPVAAYAAPRVGFQGGWILGSQPLCELECNQGLWKIAARSTTRISNRRIHLAIVWKLMLDLSKHAIPAYDLRPRSRFCASFNRGHPKVTLGQFRRGISPWFDPVGFAGRFVIGRSLNPVIGKHCMPAVSGFPLRHVAADAVAVPRRMARAAKCVCAWQVRHFER